MKVVTHECCPNALIYLVARKSSAVPDKYRWRMRNGERGVPVIHCPWCGVGLEADRKGHRGIYLVGS